MEIESVANKALKSFLETGKPKGLDPQLAGRLRNMIAFIVACDGPEELKVPPNFGFHWLVGDRAGTASMTLTRNWRLTFKVNNSRTITDLDLEDYH
jgi:toxin HigB-1